MPKVLTERFKKAVKRHVKSIPKSLKKSCPEPHFLKIFVRYRFRDHFFRIFEASGVHLVVFLGPQVASRKPNEAQGPPQASKMRPWSLQKS